MQRYFVPTQQWQTEGCRLIGQDAHHIQRVMRYSLGDQVICSDGFGNSFVMEIEQIHAEEVVCRRLQVVTDTRELPVQVTIAQGLPKGDKMVWVLQKGTELGATAFVPFESERTVVRFDGKKEVKKRERWQKIVKEAAEQAQRDVLPQVSSLIDLQELIHIDASTKLVAYEQAAIEVNQISLSPLAQQMKSLQIGDHVLLVIGPEGGLAQHEVDFLQENGFVIISLGKRILRTETASSYVLAVLSFYFEQAGGTSLWQR